MIDISTVFSETSQRLLNQTADLRALARKLDATTLTKMLLDSAEVLEAAQRDLSEVEEYAERAILCLEFLNHGGLELPSGMHALIHKYRVKHIRKAMNEWNLPIQR